MGGRDTQAGHLTPDHRFLAYKSLFDAVATREATFEASSVCVSSCAKSRR